LPLLRSTLFPYTTLFRSSETTNRSVVSRAFCRSNADRTAAKFSSADLIAVSAAGAPGADSCCVRSGSPNQRIERVGTPSFKKKSVTAFVVQRSCCTWPDGNGPSTSVIGPSASPGNDLPANSVMLFLAPAVSPLAASAELIRLSLLEG